MKIIRRSFKIEMSEHEYNIMYDALSLLHDIHEQAEDEEVEEIEEHMTERMTDLIDNFEALINLLGKDL